jgi:prepilin-type N-terminal cleavage/methylation domain-containing protein
MTLRRGVTLIEVLVASVLLAVGIAGTLNAMVASARLRMNADTREAVVGLMLDRLAWFEANACSGTDTAGVTRLAVGAEARWALRSIGSTRVLELSGVRRAGAASPRTRIVTSLPCD